VVDCGVDELQEGLRHVWSEMENHSDCVSEVHQARFEPVEITPNDVVGHGEVHKLVNALELLVHQRIGGGGRHHGPEVGEEANIHSHYIAD
jgi:hypothetical protein